MPDRDGAAMIRRVTLLIGDVLANAARVTPHAPAATLADETLTFGQVDDASNRLAHVLAGMGIEAGDRVAWWGETSLEAVPVFGALAKLGAVFAPLNARIGGDEVRPVVEYARPRLLLAGSSHVEPAAELARDLSIGLGHTAAGPGIDIVDAAQSAASTPPHLAPLDERGPHVIFFTSGSTGRPKGVVLSHRTNWLRTYVGATTTSGGRGVVCMFPLFHMAGWTIALGAWQQRRAVHFVPVPDARTLLDVTAHHGASRLYCIPAVWARILEHGVGGHDLTHLRDTDTGTSATPPELLAALKDALPWTADPRLLRLDRGRSGHPTRRRGPHAQAGQRRHRATGSRGAAERGR